MLVAGSTCTMRARCEDGSTQAGGGWASAWADTTSNGTAASPRMPPRTRKRRRVPEAYHPSRVQRGASKFDRNLAAEKL